MYKKVRHIIITILIITFIVAFSSSYSSLSMDNLSYVIAIGFDTSEDNQLEVTFEFSTESSNSESGSTEKTDPVINSVKTYSLSNAINLMNSYMGKKMNFSHCKIIVFSEQLAYNDITDELYTLINDTQIRPSSNIIISKCDANYYIKQTKPELEHLMSTYYEILTDASKYTGYIPDATIGEFFHGLISSNSQPYAILGGLTTSDNDSMGSSVSNTTSPDDTNDGSDVKASHSSITGDNGSENVGLAVFDNGTLVGELNALETVSFLVLKNDIDRFLISVPDPTKQDNYIDIYFTPEMIPDIKIDTSTTSPFITIKLKFSGRIFSMSGDSNYLTPEVLESISNSCNQYLQETFTTFLYKTSKEFYSDINGFGELSAPNFYTSKDFENYHWLDNYKNSVFNVKVETSVKSSMLITET